MFYKWLIIYVLPTNCLQTARNNAYVKNLRANVLNMYYVENIFLHRIYIDDNNNNYYTLLFKIENNTPLRFHLGFYAWQIKWAENAK